MPFLGLSKKKSGVVSRQGQSQFVVKVAAQAPYSLRPGSGIQVHRGVLVPDASRQHTDPTCNTVSKLVMGDLLQNRQQTGFPHQPSSNILFLFLVYQLVTVSQQHVLNSQIALQFEVE